MIWESKVCDFLLLDLWLRIFCVDLVMGTLPSLNAMDHKGSSLASQASHPINKSCPGHHGNSLSPKGYHLLGSFRLGLQVCLL
jgi:hypothetical protein